ncbi:MAG: T9SS type A sorting domain-containing protein [Bacteroidales bacterium]
MSLKVLHTGLFSKILISVFIAFFVSVSYSYSRVSEKLYSIGDNSPWNSASTWSRTADGIPCGLIPQNNDTVVIDRFVVLNTDFCFSGNGCLIISATGILQGSNYNMGFTGSSALNCTGELSLYNLHFSDNSYLFIDVNGQALLNNNLIVNSLNKHLVLGSITVNGNLSLGQSVEILANGLIESASYTGNGSISGVNLSNQAYYGSIISENNWLGTISCDWDEPLNWSLGVVPNGNSNISMLVSSNSPQVSGYATCNNLYVNSAVMFVVKENAVMDILGNLKVNANGEMLLKNSSIAKASLILNGDVSGEIKSEYQIVAGQKDLLSSPVGTALSSTFLNMYLRSYDESSSQWGEYITPTNDPLEVMQGYELYSLSSATRIFEGIPNHSAKSFAISNSGNGLNLTGNPYPCYVDWENNDNNAWQRNSIASAIYYPDPSGSGNFSVYLPGGDNALSLNNGNRYIAPMQGFFVKAGKQGSLTVNQNSRVRGMKDSRQGINNNSIKFRVNDSNGLSDEAAFRVMDYSTFSFDAEFDAIKLKGDAGSPNLYFGSAGDIEYAINTVPELNSSLSFPLNLTCTNAGTYTVSTQGGLNFEQAYPVILEDKELNISIDIRNDSVYSFFHSPEMDPKRFELHFNSTQGISENIEVSPQIQVRQGEILISGKSTETCTATLFSIDGKRLNSTTGILSEGISLLTGKYNNGVYILYIKNSQCSSATKILIK